MRKVPSGAPISRGASESRELYYRYSACPSSTAGKDGDLFRDPTVLMVKVGMAYLLLALHVRLQRFEPGDSFIEPKLIVSQEFGKASWSVSRLGQLLRLQRHDVHPNVKRQDSE